MSLKLNSKIPNHLTWIVKMWHFGKDSLTGYSGEKFEITWEDILNVFHHIYSKEYGGKRKTKKVMKIRKEVQKYPNKPSKKAFMDKSKVDDNDGNKTFSFEF